MYDTKTNEKHIADICTDDDVVIEFQNSPIHADEVRSRNSFYKRIVWVVNGSNFGLAKPYFFMDFRVRRDGSYLADFSFWSRGKIISNWSKSTASVFLDFDEGVLFWLKSFDDTTKRGVVKLVSKYDFLKKYSPIQIPEESS